MSKPGNAVAQSTDSVDAAVTTDATFEQQVNSAVKDLSKDEEGIWQFPEDLEISPEVKFAATLEKRRRDTESALGITKTKLKTEETLREKFEQRAVASVPLNITEAETEELEVLKLEDPEAWRQRINELETKAAATAREEFQTDKDSVSQQVELERRASVLNTFNSEHPEVQLNDEVLKSDIPPRIVRKLDEGKITFEEFLTESYNYITSGKVIKGSDVTEDPNLGTVGGSTTPSKEAQEHQDSTDYAHAVF